MCAACSAKAGAAQGSTGGLTDNVAGLLAYVTIIPAIVFLVMEPYNKNRFIRFHSFQCLFIAAAGVVVSIAFMIVGMIPFVNLLLIPISVIVWLGFLVIVVVCALKAYQGQMFKLPIIGDMAEKQANA
jgi:uncharacterized membrane protein